MARPIKETPTLYGEDARRFAHAVENPKSISAAEIAAIEASHSWFKTIANCAF